MTSEIILNEDSILVKTNANTTIECKSIVIAAGAGSFVPRKITSCRYSIFLKEKNIFLLCQKQKRIYG